VPGGVGPAGQQEETGVAHDAVRGVVDRDEEGLRRDRRPLHVARDELREVTRGGRLVAAGDVREGLDGDGVDALDEVGARGQGGQRQARR
jgi:hypothetical protein